MALIDDPDAKGYSALACDISVGGIGLNQSTAAVGGGRLLVRLPSGDKSTVAIVCSVAYCKALADGIFSVGVEFLEEVDPASARSIAWPDAPK